MVLSKDGANLYDGDFCYIEVNKELIEVRLDIEVQYGEFYSGKILDSDYNLIGRYNNAYDMEKANIYANKICWEAENK